MGKKQETMEADINAEMTDEMLEYCQNWDLED